MRGRAGRSRLRLTPGGAILLIITAAMLLYMVVPVRIYVSQRDRLQRLERQANVLRGENGRLEEEVVRLKDAGHLEELARCRGMVRPGEISFVVVPKASGASPVPAPECR